MQTANIQLPYPMKALLWGALAGVLLLSPLAAQAETYTGLYASYFEYAVANGWAKLNSDGEEEYDSGYEGEDDVDGDGLLNEEEWNGWKTTINGREGWFTGNSANVPAGVLHFGPGSNPQRFDSDCDGISDLYEASTTDAPNAGTNPRSEDTDGDGLKDAVEIYAGLNPRDDGFIYDNSVDPPVRMTDSVGDMMTLWHPDMDPDGDGISTKEELTPANNLSFRDGCPTLGGTRAHFPWDLLDSASWTSPLDCDTDGDRLLDSFEKAFSGFDPLEAAPAGDAYHYDTDADSDGLVNFREQCVHPLLSYGWPNVRAPSWPFLSGTFSAAAGESTFFTEVIGTRYGSSGRQVSGRLLNGAPGYLLTAQFDTMGNTERYYQNTYAAGVASAVPDAPAGSPGVVIWGPMSDYWTSPRPVLGAEDSDADQLPDGWEVEHGLNPLNSMDAFHSTLGDPDGDGIVNLMEYFGADGYRIDYVSGTGDETIPWITRSLNWSDALGYTAPYGYDPNIWLGMTSFTAAYAPELYPGFFDPSTIDVVDPLNTVYTPVPGVPSFPQVINDMALLYEVYGAGLGGFEMALNPALPVDGAGAFQPFLMSGLYYAEDVGVEDGRYTPGIDHLWYGTATYTAVAVPPAEASILLAGAPVDGTAGYPLTDNTPLMLPMFGNDTDEDGLSDGMELRMDVARGQQPSSPVHSHSPLVPRAAKVLDGLGMTQLYPIIGAYFSRDFTVEMWVYVEDGTPSGVLARGETSSGAAAFELGLDAGIPYITFDVPGGTWSYEARATRPIPSKRWVHLAGSFDHTDRPNGNALSLYLNGALEQSRQVLEETAGFVENSGSLIFAEGAEFADNLWVDEIRVWNVCRSAAEITDHFDHLLTSVQPGPEDPYGNYEANGLVAYYSFDDSGLSAESLVKQAWCSLTGYGYPHDADVLNYPNGQYIYPEGIFGLPTEAFGGDFVFDAGRVAPVSGGVDSQRGEWDSDGDGLPDSWELLHELNPYTRTTPPHSQASRYDPAYGFSAGPEVLIQRVGFNWRSSVDFGNSWQTVQGPIVVSMVNGVVVTSPCPNCVIVGDYSTTTNTTTEGTNTTTTLNTVTNWEIRSGQVMGFIDDGETWWVSRSGLPVAEVGVTGEMITDADGDFDGDGLTNLEEYRARTNPRSFDTDENSIPDGDEDFDGDGLSNEQESRNACRPDLADTDDDGMTDSAEVAVGAIPSDSTSPKQHLAAYFNGLPGTWLEVMDRSSLVQSSWTLEAQVLPASVDFLADGQGAAIFRRGVEEATNGMYVANYELRVVRDGAALYPEARFVYRTPQGAGVPIAVRGTDALRVSATYNPTSVHHLAATYDNLGKRLTLYVDGEQVGNVQDPNHSAPTTGEGPVSVIRIGERFRGFVDELRLWSSARDRSAIVDAMYETLEGQEEGLAAYFNFDDGGWPTLTSNTWATGMANLLYSVKAVDPTPAELAVMRDGDTWIAGADVWVNDSGNHQILGTVAALGPVFFGTDTVPAGGGAAGDFGWNHAEGILYRHDGAGFDSWGKGRHWLQDARGIIVNDVADFAAMMAYAPEPTMGDQFLCVAEQAVFIYHPQGWMIPADPLLPGHRFYSVADNAIVEWDGAAVDVIASAITDTNLYVTLQSEGLAYKSEDKIWRRWGVIPSTEDYTAPRDWENDWAAAAKMSGLVEFYEAAPASAGYVASGGKDTDGDGLPDSWEIRYGLNELDGGFGGATGSNVDLDGDGRLDYVYNAADFINGAWGDPDNDGLNNRAEWLAGTNPFEFDTDGDGYGDYDSPTTGATYGSLYMDGDNIPDSWESLFPAACSPLKFDANLDPDGDGWDNYSEYMAYYLTHSANVYTVTTNTDGTVSSNWSGGSGYSIPYCDPEDPVSYPKPHMTFRFKTDCPEALGTLRIWAYTDPKMNCPDAMTSLALDAPIRDGNSLSITDFIDGGHLRQGPTYFMAFVDENNDGQWNEPELMGFSEYMPENIQWGEATVDIALREQANGYTRISWAGAASENTNTAQTSSYIVRLLREGSVVHEFTRGGCSAGRSYLHEYDFRHAGFGPLYGVYTWQVRNANNQLLVSGTNTVDYPATLAKPIIQIPSGKIIYAQETLKTSLDPATAQLQIQIRRGATNGPSVLNKTVYAPYIKNGVGEMDLPLLAGYGAFTNGLYWIQVRAYNPRASVASDWTSFTVDLQPPSKGGAGMITGRADYFGWASNAVIVVEAYKGSGFDQRPVARVRAVSSYYKLMGLPIGDYHVRAFHDLNENGALDAGEAWTLVKGTPASVGSITWVLASIRGVSTTDRGDRRSDGARGGISITPAVSAYAADYSVKRIEMKSTAELSGNNMVLHDADSDNDGLADIWEKTFAGGSLTLMNQYTNNDADDLLDLQEFRAGTNPKNSDTDGDTLDDARELLELGTDATRKDTDGDGVDDNVELALGTDPLRADTDGDGLTDGAELNSFGTDSLLADSDGDGMDDGYEIIQGFDPLDSADGDEDADNDGLSNTDEAAQGTNPWNLDSDGDGYGDGAEIALGTNPMNAGSTPPSAIAVSGDLRISGIQTTAEGLVVTYEVDAADPVPAVLEFLVNDDMTDESGWEVVPGLQPLIQTVPAAGLSATVPVSADETIFIRIRSK